MRLFACLALTLGLLLGVAVPSVARVARIEATAPLQDHAEQSVKAALKEAVDAAVQGAVAMGLPWVHLSHAVVLANAVAVQILASDTAPDIPPEGEPGPDAQPDAGFDQPEESEL